MEKEFIVSELRKVAITNGLDSVGRKAFQDATGIREADWKGKYWINWSDVLEAAGLKPGEFNRPHDRRKMVARIAELIRELGHFPQVAELQMKRVHDPSFPNSTSIRRRIGRKKEIALAVFEWCAENDGSEDIEQICAPLLKSDKDENTEQESTSTDGYVYLMKSGKHYKIGKTNSLDRRRYEIGLQLPEKVEPVHSIATDDPSGIERYWHQRFHDKRLNGEWFELTQRDVAAFRKRRFM